MMVWEEETLYLIRMSIIARVGNLLPRGSNQTLCSWTLKFYCAGNGFLCCFSLLHSLFVTKLLCMR
jgi:hypothetical protein